MPWCTSKSRHRTPPCGHCQSRFSRDCQQSSYDVAQTADHKELKRGKPHPDPFILAAEKMGYDVRRCLVVEDSPSGIRAGIASGAKGKSLSIVPGTVTNCTFQ